jgi:hypothetical protein
LKVGRIVKRIAKASSYTSLKEFKPNPGCPEDNKRLFYDWLKDLEIVFSNEPRLMNVIRTPEIRANGISITTNTVIYSILLRYLSNDALLNAKSSSEVSEDDGIGVLRLLQTLYGTVTAVDVRKACEDLTTHAWRHDDSIQSYTTHFSKKRELFQNAKVAAGNSASLMFNADLNEENMCELYLNGMMGGLDSDTMMFSEVFDKYKELKHYIDSRLHTHTVF